MTAEEVAQQVPATVLMGLSASAGAFTEKLIKTVSYFFFLNGISDVLCGLPPSQLHLSFF